MPGVAGRSGRRPKPTAKKALAGNPGKRALNKTEPKFTEITHVDPPEWMQPLAIQMWQTVVPELLAQHIVCITDLHNVEAFCTAYANWRSAQELVVQHGPIVESAMGSPMKNPALTAAKEAMSQMVTFGAMLGLDPSSRSRLIGGKKAKANNPFADLV
ncbi:phage terminase small subunit P27 family [Phytopseudomonas punonensis]|uniref:Phage terminase, small subunit, putative, P27 family n=1 Tax=Phytopseudomonas punonensis TaxID=1220495 RepID=A0A1M7LHQ9_9GAMM|nr:phage terminase small subunit P27 family [Pseudomonas punonensis]SHM77518.1 phage terminase, small subunit, putative, P27 family [Pseudomonas punonensis]